MSAMIRARSGSKLAVMTTCIILSLATACSSSPSRSTDSNNNAPHTSSSKVSSIQGSPSPTVLGVAKPKSGNGGTIAVNGISSDDSGFTVLRWTLTNTTQRKLLPGRLLGSDSKYDHTEQETLYDGGWLPAVELVSDEKGIRYFTAQSENDCLCGGTALGDTLKPGQSAHYYNVYYIPPELKSIGVKFTAHTPVHDLNVK